MKTTITKVMTSMIMAIILFAISSMVGYKELLYTIDGTLLAPRLSYVVIGLLVAMVMLIPLITKPADPGSYRLSLVGRVLTNEKAIGISNLYLTILAVINSIMIFTGTESIYAKGYMTFSIQIAMLVLLYLLMCIASNVIEIASRRV